MIHTLLKQCIIEEVSNETNDILTHQIIRVFSVEGLCEREPLEMAQMAMAMAKCSHL
jgi:hypothetical protein